MFKFFTQKQWFLWSILGSIFILISTWYQVQLDVKINEWFGEFYDTLQKALTTPNSVSEKEFILIRPQLKIIENRILKLNEILSIPLKEQMITKENYKVKANDIKHMNSSPEEIRDITIEVMNRLEGKWHPKIDDELLQNNLKNK